MIETLKRMNTRTLLSLSFLGVIFLPALVGGVALFQLNELAGLTTKMYRHPLAVSNAVRDANLNILRIQVVVAEAFEKNAELAGDNSRDFKQVETAAARVDGHFALVRERFLGDQTSVRLVEERFKKWRIQQKRILGHLASGRREAAFDLHTGDAARQQRELDQALKALTDFAAGKAATFLGNADSSFQRTVFFLLALVLVTSALSALTAFYVVRRIGRSLDRSVDVIKNTSAQIVETVEKQEINSSRQAASLHEITTTVEQLGRTADATAHRVKEAAGALERAGDLSKGSEAMVDRLLKNMDDIREKVQAVAIMTANLSESSSRISGIAALVSQVSDQTGLLALNAAIEAVRAGEQGKGFGVVAGEIRKLADNSKDSAREINEQIRAITAAIDDTAQAMDEGKNMVDAGAELVVGTGQAFEELSTYNSTIFERVNEVTSSTAEQSLAVGHVLTALNEINQGAQENAADLIRTRSDVRGLMDGLKL